MSLALDVGILYEDATVESQEEGRHSALATAADAALVARAQTGDFTAFTELVRRYRNDVFSLAFHYLRNREEAWDASQEVFIKAHRALAQFRGEASFRTWLLRITSNQCKDFFKRRRLNTVSYDDALHADHAASSVPGPHEALEAREIGEAILLALDELPAKHKTAFVLREFEGLSYEEMARVMECSLGTVMSRLHHARKKLQNNLARMGALEGRNYV